MTGARLLILFVVAGTVTVPAQQVPLEYQVKAAYLYNFVRFVEWPPEAVPDPLAICVARPNPFSDVLANTLRGETVGGRPITSRVITDPDGSCPVVFISRNSPASPYLRAAAATPILTVGESPDFIRQGGIVNFVREGSNIRFEINEGAARRAGLRISSRLLRLARMPSGS